MFAGFHYRFVRIQNVPDDRSRMHVTVAIPSRHLPSRAAAFREWRPGYPISTEAVFNSDLRSKLSLKSGFVVGNQSPFNNDFIDRETRASTKRVDSPS